MTWQFVGPWAAALGALALAGVLFLLQRLRVRHREETVVTTLFWRQALEETRARVLVERFRHPLSYLLVLAIALATWLAAADPRLAQRGQRDQVLLLDGSAGMARAGRFEVALDALRDAAAGAPRDATTVLWCGAEVRTLLLPGEDRRLLDARLEGLAPEAAPASVERAILSVAAQFDHAGDDARDLVVSVAGDASVREDLLALLPAGIEVGRLPTGAPHGSNSGVVALGVAPAASGAWDRVDVLAETLGDATFEATLEGAALTGTRDGALLRFDDLPATGGRFELRRAGSDALDLDDAAELYLPDRARLRVVLGATVPTPLRAALVADPAVVIVTSGDAADVVVRRAGEALGAGLPAFELVPAADQAEAFLITSPASDVEAALLAAVVELGLDRIDATSIAAAAGAVITAGATTGPARGLALWEELVGPGYDLVQSRAFPLLVGQTVRWLGGVEPFAPVVRAGQPVAATIEELEPLGADPVPPRAGRYTGPGAAPLAAALLSTDASAAAVSGLDEVAADAARGVDLAALLALVALALLCVDGFLFRTGRTP